MRSLLLLPFLLLAACGGSVDGREPSEPSPRGTSEPPATSDKGEPTRVPATTNGGTTTTSDCAPSSPDLLAKSGETLARPTGSVLRLELVYQGSTVAVRAMRGVDKIIAPSVDPLSTSPHSGHWVELRKANAIVYTHLLRDPTVIEAPPPPGGGSFSNHTIDRCEAKTILVDVPNDAGELVLFASPYGTQDVAVELARFTLK